MCADGTLARNAVTSERIFAAVRGLDLAMCNKKSACLLFPHDLTRMSAYSRHLMDDNSVCDAEINDPRDKVLAILLINICLCPCTVQNPPLEHRIFVSQSLRVVPNHVIAVIVFCLRITKSRCKVDIGSLGHQLIRN